MSEEHLKDCKMQMKLLLFQNPMLVSENFPHFYYTSTIQTQCWFLKLLSHLRPTTTLFYPYRSRFGLDWNQRIFFVSHCRNICGVGQHLFSFCSTDDVCRHQSRANLSRFLQSRELFIERQLLQRLSCGPILFHLIFLSHIFQMLAIIWTYAEKYTICWD